MYLRVFFVLHSSLHVTLHNFKQMFLSIAAVKIFTKANNPECEKTISRFIAGACDRFSVQKRRSEEKIEGLDNVFVSSFDFSFLFIVIFHT